MQKIGRSEGSLIKARKEGMQGKNAKGPSLACPQDPRDLQEGYTGFP